MLARIMELEELALKGCTRSLNLSLYIGYAHRPRRTSFPFVNTTNIMLILSLELTSCFQISNQLRYRCKSRKKTS